MANVSTARKLGIAARIAGQHVKGSRTYGALLQAARASMSHFWGVFRQLWHEVTGFVFVIFAVVGVTATVREYSAYRAGHGHYERLAAAACFAAMFSWFGVSSFWRARKRT
jgi:putative exporter of polyketide antibiotics